MKDKTKVEEINRNIYDIKNKDEYQYKMKKGLSREIIEEISRQKKEAKWMRLMKNWKCQPGDHLWKNFIWMKLLLM